MIEQPTDAELESQLIGDADLFAHLRAAIETVRAASPDQLVTWSEPSGDGSSERPYTLRYPHYDRAVWDLIAALSAVGAHPVFDWMAWARTNYPEDRHAVANGTRADAMRVITTIARGERFGDGTIATALTNGTLLAAAERIAAQSTT